LRGEVDVVVYERELILSVMLAVSAECLCNSSGPISVVGVWPEVATLYAGGSAVFMTTLDQAVYLLSEDTALLKKSRIG
jgi:hypothetical protein